MPRRKQDKPDPRKTRKDPPPREPDVERPDEDEGIDERPGERRGRQNPDNYAEDPERAHSVDRTGNR
jgi:hypothetical protein